MTILYFNIGNEGTNTNPQYSLCLNLDWLDEYALKNGFGDAENFLTYYSNEDVSKVVNSLDAEDEPYSIKAEHCFSEFLN